MGGRVRVGFRDSVGVQSGQNFPSGAFGAHGVSGTADSSGWHLWQQTVGRRPQRGGGGSWCPWTREVILATHEKTL